MTSVQKQAIIAMREQGLTYSLIASQMDLSPNTVKSVCRRSDVAVQPSKGSTDGICKNCYAPLPQNTNGRKRTFCSDKCRYTWWNHKRRAHLYRLNCFCCGRQFISYGNRKRKFCGRECYTQSRYGKGLP